VTANPSFFSHFHKYQKLAQLAQFFHFSFSSSTEIDHDKGSNFGEAN
jgi:hypothetical protein